MIRGVGGQAAVRFSVPAYTPVIPAQAGIQNGKRHVVLDSRLRGNDVRPAMTNGFRDGRSLDAIRVQAPSNFGWMTTNATKLGGKPPNPSDASSHPIPIDES